MNAGKESKGQAVRRIRRRLMKVAEKQDAALAARDSVGFRELETERVELKCELEGWLS